MISSQIDLQRLRGVEKAAILFLCLGEERGSDLMQQLEDQQIRNITLAMSALGSLPQDVLKSVMLEFTESVNSGGGVTGSVQAAEEMLRKFLPERQVADILSEIRGPQKGLKMWDNLSSLNEQVIADYLQDEHDQTIAVIMTRIKPEVSAKVLPLLGRERMQTVVARMIAIDAVPKHVLEQIEETLQSEFVATASQKTGADPHQKMAYLFNKLDGSVFEELTQALEKTVPDAFNRIRQKMFTFNDLPRLDAQSLAKVMRGVEGNSLQIALRGAKKETRDTFLSALPSRSRDMLIEEMKGLGAVRGREVQKAQADLVDYALQLVKEDVIRLPADDDDDVIIE